MQRSFIFKDNTIKYCRLLLPYTPVLVRAEDLAAAVTPYWLFRAIKQGPTESLTKILVVPPGSSILLAQWTKNNNNKITKTNINHKASNYMCDNLFGINVNDHHAVFVGLKFNFMSDYLTTFFPCCSALLWRYLEYWYWPGLDWVRAKAQQGYLCDHVDFIKNALVLNV